MKDTDNSCGNVPCIARIGEVRGMHTNGKCRCLEGVDFERRRRIELKIQYEINKNRHIKQFLESLQQLIKLEFS